MRILIPILLLLHLSYNLSSQTSDDQYSKPLSEVFTEIQKKYNVKLIYSEKDIANKYLTYAEWRFRPNIEKTLENILTPVDLIYEKKNDTLYKIKEYQYYRISVQEGKEKTGYLAGLYNDSVSWIQRKNDLRKCMWNALEINGIPEWPNSKPIISNERKMDGYRIMNIALEVLPGIYTFGSVYQPIKTDQKCPIILCPNGHWSDGRYRPNHQIRCAMLAKMGAIVVSYDLFAWGESELQFETKYHRSSLAMSMQVLNSFRFLDYLISLKNSDKDRIAIVGGSGAGSHSMLITALDDRIKVSAPTVMLSSYMYGGCPCESGKPIHLCGEGTNNVELAAMAAPRPQLIISDGKDWTAHVPEIEFPYVQRIYGFFGKETLVENAHFAEEGHDFGISKRMALYPFFAKYLSIDIQKILNNKGEIDESSVTIEEMKSMYVLENKKKNLPENAITNFEDLENIFQNTFNVK